MNNPRHLFTGIALSTIIASGCAVKSETTTRRIEHATTTTASAGVPQVCVDAANATRGVFASATYIIGLSGEFFSAVGDLDMNAAETAATKIGSAARDASDQAETANQKLSDCRDANPPVACTRMADAAGEAASLLASTLQTIVDANEALGNMDAEGLSAAAAETDSLRDPLLEATRRFENASDDCVNT